MPATTHQNKFGSADFYDNFLEYTLRWEHHRRMQRFGKGFYYKSREEIFVPSTYNRNSYVEFRAFDSAMFYWIYHNAELMRWTLTDESIPLDDKKKVFDIFDGGRRSNAIALGMLRYWPALPEFREVVLYEADRYLRELCVYAIGELAERAYAYRADIRQAIRDADNEYFQVEAVDALAKLNDKDAVPLFYQLFEKMICKINQHSYDEMFKGENSSMLMLMERVLQALIKIDVCTARELLAIGLTDGNPHVVHYCKRAFQLSTDWMHFRLTQSSMSARIAYLPKDFTLRYQLRR